MEWESPPRPAELTESRLIGAILDGFADHAAVTVIEDRAAAIAWAISAAADNDVVLLAGKGHESYQIIGGERHRFSDYGIAAASLAARERRAEEGE